jgi:transcriptional regulator with XRE-family HTH domain
MATNQFRNLLQTRGLKEIDVATQIGVHKNTVSNWATGRTRVVPQRIQDLAVLLDTSIDELAGPPRAAQTTRDGGLTDREEAALQAVDVLRRLLESASALRSLNQAAPALMDVLRDAEAAVELHGSTPPPRGPDPS